MGADSRESIEVQCLSGRGVEKILTEQCHDFYGSCTFL